MDLDFFEQKQEWNVQVINKLRYTKKNLKCQYTIVDFYLGVNRNYKEGGGILYKQILENRHEEELQKVERYREGVDKKLIFFEDQAAFKTLKQDLCVTIGGDGTLLYANLLMNQMNEKLPPFQCIDHGFENENNFSENLCMKVSSETSRNSMRIRKVSADSFTHTENLSPENNDIRKRSQSYHVEKQSQTTILPDIVEREESDTPTPPKLWKISEHLTFFEENNQQDSTDHTSDQTNSDKIYSFSGTKKATPKNQKSDVEKLDFPELKPFEESQNTLTNSPSYNEMNKKKAPCFLSTHKLNSVVKNQEKIHKNFKYKEYPKCTFHSRVLAEIHHHNGDGQNPQVTKQISINNVKIERDSLCMVKLDVYIDNVFATTVSADGQVVSSSTGSTAYNSYVNGPTVQHTIDCIILNYTAPFSLTTKPIVFGPKTTITIKLSEDNRGTIRVVFDDKKVIKLEKNDHIVCSLDEEKLAQIARNGTF